MSQKITAVLMLMFFTSSLNAQQSICYGETHAGSISGAVQLPKEGSNFEVFSQLAWYMGRTYAHSLVAEVVLNSYSSLYQLKPQKVFIYAETGWAKGGSFRPHKTHQNGLSVDFMVPVIDVNGDPKVFPMHIKNRWGYDVDFDVAGNYNELKIDFETMALHLKLLHETSNKNGFDIKRVFFAPDLQKLLFETQHGSYIKNHIKFNTRQAWVRHDEHYHVDFDISCRKSN